MSSLVTLNSDLFKPGLKYLFQQSFLVKYQKKFYKYIAMSCIFKLYFCIGYNVDVCHLSERNNNAINLNYYESHCQPHCINSRAAFVMYMHQLHIQMSNLYLISTQQTLIDDLIYISCNFNVKYYIFWHLNMAKKCQSPLLAFDVISGGRALVHVLI